MATVAAPQSLQQTTEIGATSNKQISLKNSTAGVSGLVLDVTSSAGSGETQMWKIDGTTHCTYGLFAGAFTGFLRDNTGNIFFGLNDASAYILITLGSVQVGGSLAASGISCSSLTDSGLTSGRVVIAGASGLLADDADLTFSGDTLTTTKLNVGPGTLGSTVMQISSAATNDDPTELVQQNRVATTDATVTTLDTIAIPASTTVLIETTISARRTGGAAGTAEDGAGYVVRGLYKNVAGTATLIGAVSQIFVAEDQAGWDGTIAVSGGNALVRVMGAVNNNVTWHSTTRIYKVST